MKKKLQLVYVLLFFLICSIPVLSIPLLNQDESSSSEKRDKAEFPMLIVDGTFNLQFFESLNDYFTDHFNFRNEFISTNAKFMETVFGVSAEPQVIVGDNDWLYFESTLDDFSRQNVLSETEIDNIVHTIALINEYVTNKGAKFAFTVAPNKSTVYPENMPSRYVQTNNLSNLEQLSAALPEDVYVDMLNVLKNDEQVTYLARDSHWNNYGAYKGFQAMISSLGIEKENFTIVDEEVRQDFVPDLDGMMYPVNGNLDSQTHYDFNTSFEYVSRFKTMDDITIQTHSETGNDSVLVFRDSFGNALLEYFGRQFADVEFSRAVPYTINKAAEFDYVILEIVERNIPNLLKAAPIMEAPIREVISTDLEKIEPQALEVTTENGYQHIYGYIEMSDVNSIYVTVDNTTYEAFQILESDLEITMDDGLVGFSLRIPESINVSDSNIQIQIQ